MRIVGVDEAGRGCVLGPLVVAGVLVDEKGQSELSELGVKDSKLLSSRRREQLALEISRVAISTHVLRLSPEEIDKAVNRRRKLYKLNRLEATAMAEVIQTLEPDVAFVDASDVLPDRYEQHIKECLTLPVRIVSEHKADVNYPVVSAASIVAKVDRDHCIQDLKGKYGDFGSGYMTDPKTSAFLITLAKKHSDYPDFVRCSWKPAKAAMRRARTKQTRMSEKIARV